MLKKHPGFEGVRETPHNKPEDVSLAVPCHSLMTAPETMLLKQPPNTHPSAKEPAGIA